MENRDTDNYFGGNNGRGRHGEFEQGRDWRRSQPYGQGSSMEHRGHEDEQGLFESERWRRENDFTHGRHDDWNRGRRDWGTEARRFDDRGSQDRSRYQMDTGREEYQRGDYRGDYRGYRQDQQWGQRGMRGYGQSRSQGSHAGPYTGAPQAAFERAGRGELDDHDVYREGYGYGQTGHTLTGYGQGEHHNQFGVQGFNQSSQGSMGRMQRGMHYGKGPKGFSFSDEDLKKEVCRVLYRHGEIDASDVEVEVKNGEVTLTGSVDNRRTKNMIEEIVEDEILGVRDVNNQVRVKRSQSIRGSIFGGEESSEEGRTSSMRQQEKSGGARGERT